MCSTPLLYDAEIVEKEGSCTLLLMDHPHRETRLSPEALLDPGILDAIQVQRVSLEDEG